MSNRAELEADPSPDAPDLPRSTEVLDDLRVALQNLSCRSEVRSVLLYGSTLKNPAEARDTDIIIVLDDIKANVGELFGLLSLTFKKLDFHTYSLREIEEGIAYFSREYVLEYLAKGVCLYGEHVFRDAFADVTTSMYNESILIRSIEHVQMVRKVYFSVQYDDQYKLYYLNKYIIRLSRNILLFKKIATYDQLDRLSSFEVLDMVKQHDLLDARYHLAGEGPVSLEYYFKLFSDLAAHLFQCKRELV